MEMRLKRLMPKDNGLGEQVRDFDDTFSAYTVIKEMWFPHLLTDIEKKKLAERDKRK